MTTQTVTVLRHDVYHCARSVKSELAPLDGVTGAEVELQSGAVTITSSKDIEPDALKAAVDEAATRSSREVQVTSVDGPGLTLP